MLNARLDFGVGSLRREYLAKGKPGAGVVPGTVAGFALQSPWVQRERVLVQEPRHDSSHRHPRGLGLCPPVTKAGELGIRIEAACWTRALALGSEAFGGSISDKGQPEGWNCAVDSRRVCIVAPGGAARARCGAGAAP